MICIDQSLNEKIEYMKMLPKYCIGNFDYKILRELQRACRNIGYLKLFQIFEKMFLNEEEFKVLKPNACIELYQQVELFLFNSTNENKKALVLSQLIKAIKTPFMDSKHITSHQSQLQRLF